MPEMINKKHEVLTALLADPVVPLEKSTNALAGDAAVASWRDFLLQVTNPRR